MHMPTIGVKNSIGDMDMHAFWRGAERGLERLEPLQLHGEADVEWEHAAAAGGIPAVEEAGVEGGGAPDGEVGAAAEARRPVTKERRDERQAQALSCDGVRDQRRERSAIYICIVDGAGGMDRGGGPGTHRGSR